MKFTVCNEILKDSRMIRDAFRTTLDEVMESDSDVCYLDADLMSCLGTNALDSKYPGRIINCGIAEANMVGVAAGLANVGKKPYLHSFSAFATKRCFDQIYMSLGYAKLSARIVGSDPGVSAAYNGGTHMSFDDMGIMSAIPHAIVIELTDYAMTCDMVRKTKDISHAPVYLRLPRKTSYKIYEDGAEFEIGKGNTVRDGSDITLISSGFMVGKAMLAAEKLQQDGISVRVVDMFTWKPIDSDLINKCAVETGAIVTCENHNTLCGLGNAVARVVAQNNPVPMGIVGINDEFGQVGTEDYLKNAYNLTVDEIIRVAKHTLDRK